jgi:hypothetical protein
LNLRIRKRMVMLQMHYIIERGRFQRFIDGVIDRMDTAEDKARRAAQFDSLWESLLPKMSQRHLPEGTVTAIDDLSTALSMSMFASREDLEAAQVEAAKVEFVCVKVNGGDVVDTFDTKEDALALVKKHAKQRKAKLQVLDSSTGQPVVFSEEEWV